MKIYTIFLLLMLSINLGFAQQKAITGKVTAADDNLPIPGVSVKVYQSTVSTITNPDGTYTISANAKDILIFSFIGFETRNITVGQQKTINVSLSVSVTNLDEVAVVGYGTQKKVNLTGSVQTLRLDSAVNIPVTNAAQLMYGKFSGVQLTQNSGLAGEDASTINIRGLGTFSNSTPLIVIDGMQFEGMDEYNKLAPSDIETITVLKDASAGSIYGARGANGVIIINTKQGDSNSFKIEYNNYAGMQSPTVIPEFLNSYDYATLFNERYKNLANGGNFDPRYTDEQIQSIIDGSDPFRFANTNWAKESLKDAFTQNHFMAISGGKAGTTFRISGNYLTQDAIVKGKFKSDRYNFRINLNSKISKWLTIGNNLNASYSKIKGPTDGLGAVGDIINSFYRNAPTIPLYNDRGGFGYQDGARNNVNYSFPVTDNFLLSGFFGDFDSNAFNLNDRINAKFAITKNLSFETALTLNGDFFDSSDFRPVNINADNIDQTTAINRLQNDTRVHYRILTDNILRYNKSTGKNNFTVLLGYSTIYDRLDGFYASLSNFPTNGIREFDGGGTLNSLVGGVNYNNFNRVPANETATLALFSRFNYNYQGKYLFEANIRRDGSSKFGSENKFGYFPSISAGWRITEEKFMSNIMDKNWLTNLKLRASYGRTGNDRIPVNLYSDLYRVDYDYILGNTGTVVSAAALSDLGDPSIRWESTEQYDIGLDANFFKNKLSFEADYFYRKSFDVLYDNFPVPSTLGVTQLGARNSASVLNRGLELNLNYAFRNKKLNYNVGANVTKNAKNKITSLGSGVRTIDNFTIITEGEAYNSYYGYRMIGIFQTPEEITSSPVQSALTKPGDIKYADLNDDDIIDADDRTVIGNPYPEWLYGFNASTEYKGLSLSLVLQGVGNVDRLLKNGGGVEPFLDDRSNILNYWVDRWTPENPSETLPRVGGINNELTSTFYVQDASYLRLKNITIGYQLPKKITNSMKITNLRFFASGQNLLTFTKMKNYDPERGVAVNARLVPLYKVFTAGLNFTL